MHPRVFTLGSLLERHIRAVAPVNRCLFHSLAEYPRVANAAAIEALCGMSQRHLFPKALKDAESVACLSRFGEAQQRSRRFLVPDESGVKLRFQACGRSCIGFRRLRLLRKLCEKIIILKRHIHSISF